MYIIFGIFIPFLGTALGAVAVFFIKKLNNTTEKVLLGFASGVMIAASIWSLILPALELSKSWLPTAIGFTIGIIFLLLIDMFTQKIETQNKKDNFKDLLLMIIAITLHNIPEGLAVGVAFAGAMSEVSNITYIQAITLAIGVAIQNIPEGTIISLPLNNEGMSKTKAFLFGAASGIVEPIATIITILLTSIVVPVLPYFLAFAAGAMFYVVINELIPKTNKDNGTLGTLGFTIGFLLMMILDITLG